MSAIVRRFRELHKGATPLRLPNAWDAGSARLFESLGAAAIATTSAGVAWTLGYPDALGELLMKFVGDHPKEFQLANGRP